jgi:hypothetical protein
MGAADIVAAHAMKSRSTAEQETAQLSDATFFLPALAWGPFVVWEPKANYTLPNYAVKPPWVMKSMDRVHSGLPFQVAAPFPTDDSLPGLLVFARRLNLGVRPAK